MHSGGNMKYRNLCAIHGLPKFSSQTSVSSLAFTLHPWDQPRAGCPSMDHEAQSTDGEQHDLPQTREVTLIFPFMVFLLSTGANFKRPNWYVANSIFIYHNVLVQHVRNVIWFGKVLKKPLYILQGATDSQ